MSIRYRYANGSPKRSHFEGLHGFAKGNENRSVSIRNGRQKPIRICVGGLITTSATWAHNGTQIQANGRTFNGLGCTSTEARWWKQSLLGMKENDMPLRDLKEERAAKKRAKDYYR